MNTYNLCKYSNYYRSTNTPCYNRVLTMQTHGTYFITRTVHFCCLVYLCH